MSRAACGVPSGLGLRPERQGPCRPVALAFAPNQAEPSKRPAGSCERVLRYPDGRQRVIRYPLPPAGDALTTDAPCEEPLVEEWQTLNAFKSAAAAAAAAAGGGARQPAAATAPPPLAPAPAPADAPLQVPLSVPSSPLELLRLLTSPAHQQAQRELEEKVRGSYEVLDGCPWPVPRPIYVLALPQAAGDAGMGYALRTRVPRWGTEEELSRVLGRRRADGAPLISCSELRDGVVTFEDNADAERYGQLLEAEGGAEVTVVRCDSHELFRSVAAARGVVVLLRRGAFLPQPHQLAAALRAQDSADGDRL